ncbi:UDP-N-acetylmuramyl pentapeptide phosphotransferase/UDP-N-acetylglucosamine-1-phosphate transferase [Nitrospina watsonii]|uniref:UDP-N-acetylmuramyl pentapeptide phosphotransferase/UDP-N-acetylglucosamine-1-phosphate transferase n=2 Tax=Nitrospina watsonii TaxID=1323948 RepID=A0ABM9HAA3_9BACT|nr:UDP-N-acetylmuramyl pentapeptide phosphotransferase/UDP-N-acetylglucosamine-1-phosphate transferase [Nitrospina watsonii]
MWEWGWLLGTSLVSMVGTRTILYYAPTLGLVHAPSGRDSHEGLIPSGGGMGMVLASMMAGGFMFYFLTPDSVSEEEGLKLIAVLGLALPLAVVGLRDDIQHLSAKVRLGTQVAVVGGLLALMGELPDLFLTPPFSLVGEGVRVGGWVLLGLLWFAGVWWVNLFNFMDGIDGIASVQAIFMLVVGAGLSVGFFPEVLHNSVCLLMLGIVAATVGFLLFNWPPAKIFMGDCGSTWLAFMIYALALLSIQAGWLSYAVWLVLGAVFVTDATVTLVTRILCGERWYEGHCSHAYQRLSRRWDNGRPKSGHRSVTLLVIAINLLWLGPFAWACLKWQQWSIVWLALAYVPLIVATVLLGAGRPDPARADSRTHDRTGW